MRRSNNILKAYLVSLLFLTAGVALSVLLNDWHWFARSGSLVVVAGILLTSWQLIDNAQRLDVHFSDSSHDWAETAESRKRVRKHIKDDASWHNERYGLYLLIAGTLVWGFGDLLNTVLQ